MNHSKPFGESFQENPIGDWKLVFEGRVFLEFVARKPVDVDETISMLETLTEILYTKKHEILREKGIATDIKKSTDIEFTDDEIGAVFKKYSKDAS